MEPVSSGREIGFAGLNESSPNLVVFVGDRAGSDYVFLSNVFFECTDGNIQDGVFLV